MIKRIIYSIGLLAMVLSVAIPVRGGDTNTNRKFDYFFYEAQKLKQESKNSEAFDMFRHCLAIDSTSSAVMYELSTYYLRLGKPDQAVALLEKAVDNSADNYSYKIALASINSQMGRHKEAGDVYEELAKEYPAKYELNYYLADARTQQGDYQEAIEAIDALENAMGMNETFSLYKFRLYGALEKTDEAFKELEKLADKYPMEARYRILIGDVHLEKGDNEKALENYDKAHVIDPQNPYYIVSMANYYEAVGDSDAAESQIKKALVNEQIDVETKVNILTRYIGRLQATQKNIETANPLFEILLEQHPEEMDLKLMYGSLLNMQGKKEEAKFQYQLVTEMEPDNLDAWRQLLGLAFEGEDYQEMVNICKRCQELFPDSPDFYLYMGVAYYQMKDYQSSVDTYKKALEILPEDNPGAISEFYGQIGDTYYQMDQMSKAYEAYDQALKYNENNIMVLNNYSYFLSLEKRDLNKAERMSAQTVKMDPNNSTYLDTYAWVFFMQGNYVLAKVYIERALANDKTNSTELVEHYGDILFKTGDKEGAVEQWKKAKEMGKESEILDRKIAEETYIEDIKKYDAQQ